MIPFLLFTILSDFMDVEYAASIGLLSTGLLYIYYKYVRKQNYVHFTLLLAITVLISIYLFDVTFVNYFSFQYNFYIELIMFIYLSIVFFKRKYVTKMILKHSSVIDSVDLRRSIIELFNFFKLFAISLLIYMLIYTLMLLFYSYLSESVVDFISFKLRYVAVVFAIGVAQIRVLLLNYEFRRELWLPIINEQSVVTGHIAKSVSYSLNDMHLHPAVRILIFYKGMVFLTLTKDTRLNRSSYDTMLSDDLNSSENYEDCKDRLFRKLGLMYSEKPNFITKYNFNNGTRKRIFCLYTYNIKDENIIKNSFFKKGKFWSEKEIDSNRNKSVFSEMFEKEIDLLKISVFALNR